jgi:hypothetical protein
VHELEVVPPTNTSLDVDEGERKTISTWFRASGAGNQTLLWKNSWCKGWFLRVQSDGRLEGGMHSTVAGSTCGTPSSVTLATTGVDYSDGQWHHVALVVDRASEVLRMYVDGALKQEGALPDDRVGAGLNLAAGADWDGANVLEGYLDEIRVAARAESASLVAAQYASMTDALLDYGPTEQRP